MGSCCSLKANRPKGPADFQYNLVQTFESGDYTNDYLILQDSSLGEGITGSVVQVVSKSTKQTYAMKSINLSRYNKAQLKELENEIDLVRSLDHPNIIKIYKVYKSKKNIYIIMELLTGGELSSRLPNKPSEVARISTQLLSACRYWHVRGIAHRDLKLENIMYTSPDQDAPIKVIDFGLGTWYAMNFGRNNLRSSSRRIVSSSNGSVTQNSSQRTEASNGSNKYATTGSEAEPDRKKIKFMGVPEHNRSSSSSRYRRNESSSARLKRIMMSQVGTPYFSAPEVSKEKGYDQSVDLWAIGVIIYLMITRKFPFAGSSEQEIFENAARGEPCWESANWGKLPPDAKKLVESLLQPDPEQRISAEEALKSPWLQMSGKKKKNRRLSAEEGMDEDLILEKEVINSFQRFVSYTKLKRAALMVIAHHASSQKISKLRDLFLEFDIYHTGTITLEELRVALQRHGIVGDEVDVLFQDLDQDRSGQIRYMEFLAATIETQKFISADEMAEAFDHLDTDHSGYITKRNLQKLLGQEFSKEDVEEMIRESDLTRDGQVSKKEFMELMIESKDKRLKEAVIDAQPLPETGAVHQPPEISTNVVKKTNGEESLILG